MRPPGCAVPRDTHNAPPLFETLYPYLIYTRPLTWPGRRFDQKGTAPSVEQGHCTLIAVKRYRDPPRIGGRHNFLLLDPRWSPCLKKRKKPNEPASRPSGQKGAPACCACALNMLYPLQKLTEDKNQPIKTMLR